MTIPMLAVVVAVPGAERGAGAAGGGVPRLQLPPPAPALPQPPGHRPLGLDPRHHRHRVRAPRRLHGAAPPPRRAAGDSCGGRPVRGRHEAGGGESAGGRGRARLLSAAATPGQLLDSTFHFHTKYSKQIKL